jgi:phosphopantothenoylcysteine decarboxylase/phosphopantothenate--cysteine ligase
VTLVHDGPDVHGADVETVESAAEMHDAVLAAVAGAGTDRADAADAFVSAAAVSDFTVERASEKIRSGEPITLELTPTQKVVDGVRDAHPDLPIVGFKAETSGDDEATIERARRLADRVGAAVVVANDASVMGATETRALLVRSSTVDEYAGSKAGLGARIADELATILD